MNEKSLDLQALNKRLEKVERQNRILKISGIVLLILFGALISMGQISANLSPKATFVDALAINNNQGQLRFFVACDKEDNTIMAFTDKAKPKMQIGIDKGKPTILLLKQEGSSESLLLTPTEISFRDKHGKIVWAATPTGVWQSSMRP
jgi:hypothetical protein